MKVSSLEELRKLRGGMKQAEVAALTDGFLSQGKLSSIERGVLPSTARQLMQTVKALNLAYRVAMEIEDFLKLQQGEMVDVAEVIESEAACL